MAPFLPAPTSRWLAVALVAATSAAACSSGSRPVAALTTVVPPTAPAPAATTSTTTAADAAPITTSPTSTTAASHLPGAAPPPPAPGAPTPVGWTVGPWQPAGRPVNGSPAVVTSTLQPTSGGPAVGAARLDTSRLRVVLYAGTTDPGGTWTAQGEVAPNLESTLVATFNSGFKFNQARGGFYADGRAGVALRAGAASLVIYADGSATVGEWGRDAALTPNVVAVRQNLELLVDAGRPAANASTNVQVNWGFMLNGMIVNWRSAVGVDAAGRLLYVGGPGLDPPSLAGALIAIGAVRAMELDVNPAWVSFDTFSGGTGSGGTGSGGTGSGGTGSIVGTKLLPTMNFPENHYLSPSPRDFVAVFVR